MMPELAAGLRSLVEVPPAGAALHVPRKWRLILTAGSYFDPLSL
jgi:hypothetical protein